MEPSVKILVQQRCEAAAAMLHCTHCFEGDTERGNARGTRTMLVQVGARARARACCCIFQAC